MTKGDFFSQKDDSILSGQPSNVYPIKRNPWRATDACVNPLVMMVALRFIYKVLTVADDVMDFLENFGIYSKF